MGIPSYELVLRRPERRDRVRYLNREDAQIGDVVEIDGLPWLVVAKEPPFALRRMERVICVPRRVRRLH